MSSVALVGVDGSGKTTVANMLLASFPAPMKYVYMGTSVHSSNITLPTSRLILYLKLRSHRGSASRSQTAQDTSVLTHHIEQGKTGESASQRSSLWIAARLVNRMAEESFRQIVAWWYQMRGYVVLYDRHFIFEFASKRTDVANGNAPLSERIHLWFLDHLYPKPDLVIFLDAPIDVLMQRKQEWTTEHLLTHQTAIRQEGQRTANFVQIDASQPVDQVYAQVSRQITQYLEPGRPRWRSGLAGRRPSRKG